MSNIEWPPKDVRLKVMSSALREIAKFAKDGVQHTSAPQLETMLLQIVGVAHTAVVFEPKED